MKVQARVLGDALVPCGSRPWTEDSLLPLNHLEAGGKMKGDVHEVFVQDPSILANLAQSPDKAKVTTSSEDRPSFVPKPCSQRPWTLENQCFVVLI